MQIILDFHPQIRKAVDVYTQNWQLSQNPIFLTNEFNFGIEVQTCPQIYHSQYPSTVLNFKVKDLHLYLSRTAWSTILKLIAIYQNGSKKKTIFKIFEGEEEQEDSILEEQKNDI